MVYNKAKIEHNFLLFCFQEVSFMLDIRNFSLKDQKRIFSAAAKDEIAKTHAAGLPAAQADETGTYLLYPDGKKAYKGKKINEPREAAACRVRRTERVR
jgi:hypothetical protein